MTVHTYRVKKGESARSVSEKFAVPESTIGRVNPGPFYEGRPISVPVDILRIPPGASENAAEYFEVPRSRIVELEDAAYIFFL